MIHFRIFCSRATTKFAQNSLRLFREPFASSNRQSPELRLQTYFVQDRKQIFIFFHFVFFQFIVEHDERENKIFIGTYAINGNRSTEPTSFFFAEQQSLNKIEKKLEPLEPCDAMIEESKELRLLRALWV